MYKYCLLTGAFIVRIRCGTHQLIYQARNWTILIKTLRMWKCSCFLNVPYCSPFFFFAYKVVFSLKNENKIVLQFVLHYTMNFNNLGVDCCYLGRGGVHSRAKIKCIFLLQLQIKMTVRKTYQCQAVPTRKLFSTVLSALPMASAQLPRQKRWPPPSSPRWRTRAQSPCFPRSSWRLPPSRSLQEVD